MLIDILTIFPEMFEGPFAASIVGRAQAAGVATIRVRNLRDWTHDRHHVIDDTPYGGGGGMVMKAGPLVEAIESVRADAGGLPPDAPARVVYLTPQGAPYSQAAARRLAQVGHLVLLCGHYEEVDERVRELAIDEEISIGDYVLTGGELPAMVVVDSVVRLLPGAVGNPESVRHESFTEGLLDYPHYTRPEEFRGHRVPEVLQSGHHAKIEQWRRMKALERTLRMRPDLLERANLSPEDCRLLAEVVDELAQGELKAQES